VFIINDLLVHIIVFIIIIFLTTSVYARADTQNTRNTQKTNNNHKIK